MKKSIKKLASEFLNGKQLRIAAKKGLTVHYIEKYYDSRQDCDNGFDGECVLEKAKIGYYIGDTHINLDNFKDKDLICGDLPEGTFCVKPVEGVKYE